MTHPLASALLFPQCSACHLCAAWSDSGGQICLSCQQKLEKIRMPRPFQPPRGAPLHACAAVWRYREPARELIRLLKYRGDTGIAQFIGEQMSWTLARQTELPADMLAAVPLHETRLQERGFNQAALLAEIISAHTGLPLAAEALVRIRRTETLVHSSREERLRAIRNAFSASPQLAKGKRIVLIDDVFTTGATSIACAMALLQAGARQVSVLTACRA